METSPSKPWRRPVVCYDIESGRRREFPSIAALARALGKNSANINEAIRLRGHYLNWIVAFKEDEEKAKEKLRVFQGKTNFKRKKAKPEDLVSLRIDKHTVILVTPDKATEEYAEQWRRRHDMDTHYTRGNSYSRDFIDMNNTLKLKRK